MQQVAWMIENKIDENVILLRRVSGMVSSAVAEDQVVEGRYGDSRLADEISPVFLATLNGTQWKNS